MFEARSTVVLRRVIYALLLGAAIGTMTMRLVDPARAARLEMLDRHQARMETLNARLARSNVELATEIRALETDPEGWREVARRSHGMILPGEVIFRFPTPSR